MIVSNVLKSKGSNVETATPDDSILQLAERLAEKNIGALLIIGADNALVGIASERDVVRRFASSGGDCSAVKARDIMTADVLTCTPGDELDKVMGVMTSNRIRHLPVMENGKLAGIITIGDVVKHRLSEVELEAEEMKRYIAG